MVAKAMGRRWIGIDIVPPYAELARDRGRQADAFRPLLFVERAITGRPNWTHRQGHANLVSEADCQVVEVTEASVEAFAVGKASLLIA